MTYKLLKDGTLCLDDLDFYIDSVKRVMVNQKENGIPFCRLFYEDSVDEIVHCKDCKNWGTGIAGETEDVKCCDYGKYMVGKNGFCCYGDKGELR